MSRPGQTLNALGYRQAVLVGGTDVLGETLGLLQGTVVGPLPWDVPQETGEEMTPATVQFGALGVLWHDTANGERSTIQVAGQVRVRVHGPALAGKSLCLDPDHPGSLHYDNTGEGIPVARALENGADGLVVAYLEGFPYVPPDASGQENTP